MVQPLENRVARTPEEMMETLHLDTRWRGARGGDGGAAVAVAERNLSYYFNSLHIQLQPGSIIRQIIRYLNIT